MVAVLSGPGGATLRSFDVLKGHLILEKKLHAPESGQIAEPNHLGTAIAFAPSIDHPDIFVLTNGHTIRSVDGTTGEAKWTWVSPDRRRVILLEFAPGTLDFSLISSNVHACCIVLWWSTHK